LRAARFIRRAITRAPQSAEADGLLARGIEYLPDEAARSRYAPLLAAPAKATPVAR
jgi:hypothetical protein